MPKRVATLHSTRGGVESWSTQAPTVKAPDAPDVHCAKPLLLIVTAVVAVPFASMTPQFA
ncbi:MAG: hypothetical protein WAM04_21855 [Candidatus Sulfotelmatobacter sp.]